MCVFDRPKGLLYDAERDLLAIAKSLVERTYRPCGLAHREPVAIG